MANRNRFINPLFQRTDPEAAPLPGFEEHVQTEEVAEEEEASEASARRDHCADPRADATAWPRPPSGRSYCPRDGSRDV